MTVVLSNQIDAARKSADQLETEILLQHRGAMLCYDVQDLVAEIVRLYKEICRHVQKWQDDIEKTAPAGQQELADFEPKWMELYGNLQNSAVKVTGLIKAMEEAGYDIDAKEEFRATIAGLRAVTSFSLQRVQAGFDSLSRGEGMELGAFIATVQSDSIP